jgi:cysteine-rich repeat protein
MSRSAWAHSRRSQRTARVRGRAERSHEAYVTKYLRRQRHRGVHEGLRDRGCIKARTLAPCCGDGIIDSAHSEECDDGDNNGNARCHKHCSLEPPH